MTVMITGGCGFVGLNIAHHLLAKGQDVLIVDRNPIPGQVAFQADALPGKLTVATADVTDRQVIETSIRAYGVNAVVHGAAITAGLEREASQSDQIVEVNLIGTIRVLEAALSCGVSRVVQLGTGSVFGSSVKAQGWLDEVTDIPVPDSMYGITKYAAERTAIRFRNTRGLNVTVARLGVVFGRYEYDTGVRDTLSAPLALAKLAQKSQHARVYAGLPDDWVYAEDVAIAVDLLLQQRQTADVYQVSAGATWSVGAWCERLKNIYPDFTYELVHQQADADVGRLTPTRRPPFSIARLSRDVEYEPRFLLEKAFDDYMQWHEALGQ